MEVPEAVRKLYEASQDVINCNDRQKLAGAIARLACEAVEADTVSVVLPDGDGASCVAHLGRNPQGQSADLLLGVAATTAERVPTRGPFLAPGESGTEDIVFLLASGDARAGIIRVRRAGTARPFAAEDLARVGFVGSQALLALKNLDLWRQIGRSERDAALGRVTAEIGHEINNALTAILGSVQLATSNLDDLTASLGRARVASSDVAVSLGTVRLELAEAEKATTAIAAMVGNIRRATRREEVFGVLDVNDAIRAAVVLAGTTVRRGAQLEQTLGEGLLVRGDLGRLCQVFLNLLVNAVQALQTARTAQPRVQVSSFLDGDEVTAEVADNGPGIAPENLSRVFEPFFTTKTPDEGTGLGLAISADIVRRHAGRIDVTSKEGGGTSFSVRLPAASIQR